jgi:hypothetical protein
MLRVVRYNAPLEPKRTTQLKISCPHRIAKLGRVAQTWPKSLSQPPAQ